MSTETKKQPSCAHSCGPGDFCPGGKCDRMGCYEHTPPRPWRIAQHNTRLVDLYQYGEEARSQDGVRKLYSRGQGRWVVTQGRLLPLRFKAQSLVEAIAKANALLDKKNLTPPKL